MPEMSQLCDTGIVRQHATEGNDIDGAGQFGQIDRRANRNLAATAPAQQNDRALALRTIALFQQHTVNFVGDTQVVDGAVAPVRRDEHLQRVAQIDKQAKYAVGIFQTQFFDLLPDTSKKALAGQPVVGHRVRIDIGDHLGSRQPLL